MKTVLLLGVLLALLGAGCATASKPTAADDAFDEFHTRMMAVYPSASAAQPFRPTVKERVTETNQSLFALPPPFLQLSEQKATREELEKSGVSAALVQKMLQGQILSLAEIQELTQKKVSVTNLVKYVRSTGAIYTLTTKQIDELRAASVSNEVVDYLLTTPAMRRTLYYPTLYPSYRYRLYYPSWDYYRSHYDLHHYDLHHDSHHH